MGVFASIFAILASLVLPIAAAVWLSLKNKGYLKPILLGVLTFGFFQVVTRIPALALLGQTVWYAMFPTTQPVLYALFLGVTAGLFEEGGRWIVMTLFMKNRRRVSDGIAFGVGHGGLEAVLLVGINALLMLLFNGASTMPGATFAGGLERIFTLVYHVGFSIMVLKSVTLKKPLWLLAAFVLHAAVDTAAVLAQQTRVSILGIETGIGVVAVFFLVFIIVQYKKYRGVEITCRSSEN